jgi:predicted nucleic acid-binding Zn ribbon protein
MSRETGPQPLRNIIPELLARKGYGQELASNERASIWRELVGTPFHSTTGLGRLRRGVLEIFVNNSVILQELSMQKSSLLREMRARLPEHKIQDLRFRIGSTEAT